MIMLPRRGTRAALPFVFTVLLALALAALPARGAAKATSRVYAFGVVGSSGKLGALAHRAPALVPGIAGRVVQVVATNSDGYALTADGSVWAWGVGSLGELGTGTTVPSMTTALRVNLPAGVRIVALPEPMPYDSGMAIDSQGNAWGWGVNADHSLCLSETTPVLAPVRVPLADVTLATGAGTHALYDSSGRVYACGVGTQGQLGDGGFADSATPVAVRGLPAGRVESLESSYEGSGALLANGDYYDWGLNTSGQLGDAKESNSDVPVRVSLPARATQVAQGGSQTQNGQTVALLANGSAWTWGSGRWGQLGDGKTANSPTPIRLSLPAGVRFVHVSSGGYSSYGIDGARRLWSWGRNEFGQLGSGSSAQMALTPTLTGLHLSGVSATATNAAGFSTS